MTEEEIRIIVDRVFTELRNNSKTIAQLSEKTEVDNCWFEIDNGFKISLSTLKKYIAGTESINISELSDLDNYKLTTHRGVFNVYRGNILVGVLFIIQYRAPQHGGLQIFISGFNYKDLGASSLSMFSIIYRSTDYNNIQVWGEWKPYQNTFISNDGSVPTNNGLGFNETNFAPSLSLFFKKLAYPKIVSWSGEVIEDADIVSAGTGQVGSIVYILSKKTFALGVGASIAGGYRKYYSFFEGIEDFQQNLYDSINRDSDFVPNFTKNIFKGNDGSIWIADSASSIKKIIDISADAPKDGKQYVRKDGKWTPFVSVNNGDIVLPDKSTMTLDAYKTSGRSDAIGVVFDKYKGLFVKKDYYSGTLIANQSVALEIFYSKVKCHAPYDGRTTQKLNLLHSSNPSTEFPVFNYAEQNGVYVASNGEIEQIKEVNESLQAIKSNIVSFSYIASCTQRPKATSSASVFYGGAWGASDYKNPSTALNYLLIDIL